MLYLSMNKHANKWTVPAEWKGERCFIIAGGESVREQEHLIPKLKGRIIAIKQSVALRPNADVMFIAGKDDGRVCKDFFPLFKGKYIISRGPYEDIPPQTKILCRTKIADRLCLMPTHLAGLDAGSSSINLAFHFESNEIILLGFDMTGGRWLNGRYKHHLPFPPKEHHRRHATSLTRMSVDLASQGIKVYNCSPISALTCFEKKPLEAFL